MKTPGRKKEIVATAAELFKEKGYRAVTMRDLAEELGIKAASLYNHIHSKQEILSLIVFSVAEDFTQHINHLFPQELSSLEKLEEIIQMHIDTAIEKTDFLACMNNDWMHLEETQMSRFLEMRNDYENKFRKIVLKGIKNNELQNQNPEIVLFSILSTLRTFYLWYSKKNSLSPNDLKQNMTKTLLYGIKR